MEVNYNFSSILMQEISGTPITLQIKNTVKQTYVKGSLLLDRLNDYYKTDATLSFIAQLRNKLSNSKSNIR